MTDLKPRPCFVYVLGSLVSGDQSGMSTYVGWSNNLEARISKHNKGTGAKFTRGRQWQLLYVEIFFSRGEAMSREWNLKRDKKFRKTLLQNWFD